MRVCFQNSCDLAHLDKIAIWLNRQGSTDQNKSLFLVSSKNVSKLHKLAVLEVFMNLR